MDDTDDDIPQLSAETLKALGEFYKEQEALMSDNCRNDVDAANSNSGAFEKDFHSCFPEDWQMSQFWYDDATSNILAQRVINLAGSHNQIACLSCPSVFRACGMSKNIHLFEYDKRFARFGSTYFFFDYNYPENIPQECEGAYSVVIADPPFLSTECLEKLVVAIKRLIKKDGQIILCTGSVMEDKAIELLGLRKTPFAPKHQKNLENEFSCFTNFDWEIIKED